MGQDTNAGAAAPAQVPSASTATLAVTQQAAVKQVLTQVNLMADMNLMDQELYHDIELDLAEAFLETDQSVDQSLESSKKNSKAEGKLKALK